MGQSGVNLLAPPYLGGGGGGSELGGVAGGEVV